METFTPVPLDAHHARSRSASAPTATTFALVFTPLFPPPPPYVPPPPLAPPTSSCSRQSANARSHSYPVTPSRTPRTRFRSHSGPNTTTADTPRGSGPSRHSKTRVRERSNTTNPSFSTSRMPSSSSSASSSSSRTHLSTSTYAGSSDDASGSGQVTPRPRSPGPPGSPPPYSLTPPGTDSSSPFLFKRAASSPHLHSPPGTPPMRHYYPHSTNASRISSSSSLNTHSHTHLHHRGLRYNGYQPAVDTSDDADTDADASLSEDTVIYTATHPTLAATLRARLMGKGKGRRRASDSSEAEISLRSITTAPGAVGAGETETEGEDTPPHQLPTARITPPSTSPISLSPLPFLSSISSTATAPLPSPIKRLIPLLWELARLLSIVPAAFGTLYNLYHVFFSPQDTFWWRVEYFVCALWSILTGWQCLRMTSGLLKRWRVYYSPLPTLIRLLGLQAICWPATHFTLTILEHHKRPLICWAVIATTTCCSRSIQMWVTSNIILTTSPHSKHHQHNHHNHNHCNQHNGHHHLSGPNNATTDDRSTHVTAVTTTSPISSTIPSPPSATSASSNCTLCATPANNVNNTCTRCTISTSTAATAGRKRKWDWAAVGAKCALPAGMLYFVMAWVEVLRREFENGGRVGGIGSGC